jgi:uncharacterized membrane protein
MRLMAVALVATALVACASEDEEVAPPAGPARAPTTLAERACPQGSNLTFEDFGGPFLYSWCNGCHTSTLAEGQRQNAPMNVNFDTIEDVRGWADRIWARAGDHNVSMPPIGGPEDPVRADLGEWLACGSRTLADMK